MEDSISSHMLIARMVEAQERQNREHSAQMQELVSHVVEQNKMLLRTYMQDNSPNSPPSGPRPSPNTTTGGPDIEVGGGRKTNLVDIPHQDDGLGLLPGTQGEV